MSFHMSIEAIFIALGCLLQYTSMIFFLGYMIGKCRS